VSQTLKRIGKGAVHAVVLGLLALLPAYLAVLLMLKAMKSVGKLVQPFTHLFPKWLPGEDVAALLLLLLVCLLVGAALLTRLGRAASDRIESTVLQKIPAYGLIRSMTRQLAGERTESAWKPALAEIEEALVPAFIIEGLEDGRYTIFVPSIPTPMAGSVYVISAARVHPLDISLAQMIKVVTRWGSGAKDLLAATEHDSSLQGLKIR
jgi:uncharacterized membrane protein